MKIKTKLLDTFEKSFERLYQIRKLIREDKMNELSDEINEFYEKNETLINKWKAVFDFNSNVNPFPIKKEEILGFFAKPVFKWDIKEGETVWHSLVDSDIDQPTNDFHYLDIYIYYNDKDLEVELYEWYHFPEDVVVQEKEDFNKVIFSCSFSKGLEKKRLGICNDSFVRICSYGGRIR